MAHTATKGSMDEQRRNVVVDIERGDEPGTATAVLSTSTCIEIWREDFAYSEPKEIAALLAMIDREAPPEDHDDLHKVVLDRVAELVKEDKATAQEAETLRAQFDKDFPIISYGDKSNEPVPQWLVDGVILEGSFTLFVGPTSCGKSAILASLAKSVQHGGDFLGRKVKRGSVFYISTESARGVAWRYRAACGGKILEPQMQGIGQPVDLRDPTFVQWLIDKLDAMDPRPVLLVVDTYHMSITGDEKDNEVARDFLRSVDRIHKAVGCSTAGAHHFGKDETKGARGASGLPANCDAEYHVHKTPKGHVRLFNNKMRDWKDKFTIWGRLQEVGFVDCDGKPFSSVCLAEGEAEPDDAAERLIERLDGLLRDVNRAPDRKKNPGKLDERMWYVTELRQALNDDGHKVAEKTVGEALAREEKRCLGLFVQVATGQNGTLQWAWVSRARLRDDDIVRGETTPLQQQRKDTDD